MQVISSMSPLSNRVARCISLLRLVETSDARVTQDVKTLNTLTNIEQNLLTILLNQGPSIAPVLQVDQIPIARESFNQHSQAFTDTITPLFNKLNENIQILVAMETQEKLCQVHD